VRKRRKHAKKEAARCMLYTHHLFEVQFRGKDVEGRAVCDGDELLEDGVNGCWQYCHQSRSSEGRGVGEVLVADVVGD
jgi:hypothetical protein